jgi:hypothetical protein
MTALVIDVGTPFVPPVRPSSPRWSGYPPEHICWGCSLSGTIALTGKGAQATLHITGAATATLNGSISLTGIALLLEEIHFCAALALANVAAQVKCLFEC